MAHDDQDRGLLAATDVVRPSRTTPSSPQGSRVAVVWVPDWPLVAAGVPPDQPAAVFSANRVVACTAIARAADVRRHMRRREAQSRCPALRVLDDDPDRDARAFEAVALAVEAFTPRIEITRPGECAFSTRGPSRYFGGDRALAERIVAALDADGVRATVGVADGIFTAQQAARRPYQAASRGEAPIHVVAPGGSARFLAALSINVLDRPEFTDVLHRLGIHTLGDLAALPGKDVLGRFGSDGELAHRLAQGLDARPLATEPPPPDLAVSTELDPPAERVEPLAFVARVLAEEFHHRLEARGSACTRILVMAETEHGERHERVWRHESALSSGAIADRVRWQLDGWLNAPASRRPTAGIVHLEIRPDEVVPAGGRQLMLWGGDTAATERAVRAIARVQGLLGHSAVSVPEYTGGRDPGEQVRLVPAGAIDMSDDRPSARSGWVTDPWPGQLPNPSPATIHPRPLPVDVLDRSGHAIVVDGRCEPTAAPDHLRIAGRRYQIRSWAGPWPVDERWWDPERHSRRARFQVVTDDGAARLVVLEAGRWAITATYD